MAGVVWNQTVIMALYMALGFGLYKAGKITQEGSRALGTLLLWLVLPAVILDSFCVQFSPDRLEQLGTSALLGVLALEIALCVARLLYPEAPIDNFSAAFSNAGFMGIPLVREALGGEAVFYLVAMITLLNILQWTYGAAVLRRQPFRPHLRNLVGNPLFVAGIAGLAVFVTGIGGRMPLLVQSAVNGISALNAPPGYAGAGDIPGPDAPAGLGCTASSVRGERRPPASDPRIDHSCISAAAGTADCQAGGPVGGRSPSGGQCGRLRPAV